MNISENRSHLNYPELKGLTYIRALEPFITELDELEVAFEEHGSSSIVHDSESSLDTVSHSLDSKLGRCFLLIDVLHILVGSLDVFLLLNK